MDHYICPDCRGTGKVRWGRVRVECPRCDGAGHVPAIDCPHCGGNGKAECECTQGMGVQTAEPDCLACNGSGMRPCLKCRGTGKLIKK